MSRDGRLGVGVIGAGKVGPVLAAALRAAGHAVIGVTAGSDPDRVAAVLPDVPVLDSLEVARRSELVIVAVPSLELPGLVSGIAEVGGWQAGQLLLHTAARFGVQVLAPAAACGAIPLAVHPAVPLTGTSLDLHKLAQGYAAVTAPAAVLPIAQALAVELGCEPVVVAESDRPAYAEAVATATEFSAAIVRQASDLLVTAGVRSPGSFLSALMHASVDQALTEAGRAGSDHTGTTIDE